MSILSTDIASNTFHDLIERHRIMSIHQSGIMNVIHKLFDCSIPLIITYFSGQQRILDTAPLSSYKLVMHLYPFTWNFTCSCSSSETIDSYKYTAVSHLEKNIKIFKLKKKLWQNMVSSSTFTIQSAKLQILQIYLMTY